jgi:hypothetical protein
MIFYFYVQVGQTMKDCMGGSTALLDELESLHGFQFTGVPAPTHSQQDIVDYTIRTLNPFKAKLEMNKHNCDRRLAENKA